MVVVVFRNRLRPDVEADYGPRADEILELARQTPGFVSFKAFTADDGERLALSEFESEEAVRVWGAHLEHRKAQQEGRDRYYAEYTLQICSVSRASSFPS